MAQPALAERCRAVALAQGERPEYAYGLKRRVMGLLDTDPGAFSDLLLRTELQLGPVLRAIMGDHAFLDSWHSFTLYPEAPKPHLTALPGGAISRTLTTTNSCVRAYDAMQTRTPDFSYSIWCARGLTQPQLCAFPGVW
jgi:hypothetical protein